MLLQTLAAAGARLQTPESQRRALLERIAVDIGAFSLEGLHEWKPLLQESHSELQPQISPNGKWMAYCSDESGVPEVYVRPFPDVNEGRTQVSAEGGFSPLWSPDSRELFYSFGGPIMAVKMETEPAFKPGKPDSLFQSTNNFVLGWDIHPDGKHFLMISPLQENELVAD